MGRSMKAFGVAVTLGVAVAVAVFVWPTRYRYDQTARSYLRMDRFSGKIERLTDDGWRPIYGTMASDYYIPTISTATSPAPPVVAAQPPVTAPAFLAGLERELNSVNPQPLPLDPARAIIYNEGPRGALVTDGHVMMDMTNNASGLEIVRMNVSLAMPDGMTADIALLPTGRVGPGVRGAFRSIQPYGANPAERLPVKISSVMVVPTDH